MAVVIGLNEVASIASKLKKQNKRVVLIHGCFDLLHKGHLELFESAKKRGVVFVGVDSDESVRNLKGEMRPIMPFTKRIEAIKRKRSVNFVFAIEPGKDYSAYFKSLYKNISPDFLITADGEHLQKREKDAKELGIEFVVMKKKVFLNKS